MMPTRWVTVMFVGLSVWIVLIALMKGQQS